MEIGIFESVFPRPTLEATLDAVAAHRLRHVQFDFASAGLPSPPEVIPAGLPERVRRAADERGIRLAAVSGTYNMAHPDPAVRARGLAALRTIGAACGEMGAATITLCTGTRDPENMWRRHPANATPEAWADMLASVVAALAIADEFDIEIAFEPEPANIVANAALGRKLLREVAHPRLKVVMDPANILASDRERPTRTVLDEAFGLLGEHIVVAHAKDLTPDGAFTAAGRGVVLWDHCLALFRDARFAGPLILHSLEEDDADRAIRFLGERIVHHVAN